MQPSFTPDSAPVFVDRVEWVPASPSVLHVHLLGRWRDRPAREPLALLVGGQGAQRARFAALEQAPAGVLAAFAVPVELRGRLTADIALAVGADELALPGAVIGPPPRDASAPGDEGPPGEVIDRAVLAERRARRAELAEESVVRRAAEAERAARTLEAQLAHLEASLVGAHAERDELRAALEDAERRLRAAQQREYAEQRSRIEAQDEAERLRRAHEQETAELRGRLEAAGRRAEDTARELERARRALAEAQRRSEADRAALRRRADHGRRPAEGGAQARDGLAASLAEVTALAGELRDALLAEQAARQAVQGELAEARDRVATERLAAAEALAELAREQARSRELEERVAEALAGARTASGDEARDAEVRRLVAEVLATAAALRAAFEEESRRLETELTAVLVRERARMVSEPAAQLEAERRARSLAEAEVARLRQATSAPPLASAPERRSAEEGPGARALVADLEQAAERLREQAPPTGQDDVADPGPGAATPEDGGDRGVLLAPRVTAPSPPLPWLAVAVGRMDPDAAARFLVALLPVQRLRLDAALTYDLTLAEVGTVRVALAGAAVVEPRPGPGPRHEVDFHLSGSAASLAPVVVGGARRRPADARLRGSRRRLRRLLRGMRDPVRLSEVARSGASVEPGLILAALAAAIPPEAPRGHRFTVTWVVTGARGGVWTVRVDGRAPVVEPGRPAGGPTATVRVPHAAFLPLLAGFATPPGQDAVVFGDLPAVELLRRWFDAAQGRQTP